MQHELNEEEIRDLYAWIDNATFSRPKRNLARDFSDGVSCAELLYHYVPKLVELHNYPPSNSLAAKMYNWHTLNNKVFKKLGYNTTLEIMTCIVHMRPGYAEYLLWDLKLKAKFVLMKVDKYLGILPPVKLGRNRKTSGEGKRIPSKRIQIDDAKSKSPDALHASKAHSRDQKPSESSYARYEVERQPRFEDNESHRPHDPAEYEETIKIMAMKMKRMEELLKLKDNKIQELSS